MTTIAEQNKQRISLTQLSFRFLVSSGLMIWLLYMIDWNTALQLMKEGNLLFFAAAFITIQLTVASSVWKWQLLVLIFLKKNQSQHAKLSTLGRYYYIGLFFNNFLPGSVGGDVMRIVSLGKNVGMAPATTSVAFERLTSGAALTAIVLIASLFMDSVRPFLLAIYGVTALLVALFFILTIWLKHQAQAEKRTQAVALKTGMLAQIMNKGNQAVVQLGETAANYQNQGWLWWTTIAILSFFFQIGMAWINQLLFLGFGIHIGWLDLLVIISLISFLTMLPFSLNGIGIREVSYVFFFNQLGIPEEISVSVSLLFFILVTISSLVGGLFWLMERRGRGHEAIRQSNH